MAEVAASGSASRRAKGLVLHQVGYDRARAPIVHRASLAEMYVPYGDPAPTHRFKNVFDQGEYGVGWLANPLTLGCDCVGHIHYFDGVVNDQDGEPVVIPNAICMHEEDAGIGVEAHRLPHRSDVEVRRLRRLVISTIATVGNYEYGYFWYLYNDGTIEYEVKLTGVISTGALAARRDARHGTLVAPGLYGPAPPALLLRAAGHGGRRHRELRSSRSTPCRSPSGPDNPTGNAWEAERTVLATEAAARRDDRPEEGALLEDRERGARSSALGDTDGLQADARRERARRCISPDALLRARGPGSPSTTLWVTPYDPTQRFAAGDYPNQHPGGDRPAGVRRGRPAARGHRRGGLVHVRRPPRRAAGGLAGDAGDHIGFKLKPSGFFDGNPALDLPPADDGCHPGGLPGVDEVHGNGQPG